MAVQPQLVPEVQPQGTTPDRYTRVSSQPADFGPGIGGGLQALGQGAMQMGEFFGKAAADDAANQYQEGVQKILTGDPNVQVQGPDGKMVQDTGYLGLKGRAALDARPDVERRIDELRRTLGGGLKSLKSDLEFDNYTRRFKAITDAQVGNHARVQANVYASHVNSATAKIALDEIAANFDNPEKMQEATQRLIGARVKQAELNGGGPELTEEALKGALRDGLSAQLQAIAVKDPARAIRVLEKNREVAGAQFDNLYNSFRARADQQIGTEYADRVVGSATSLQDGSDTLATLRHFEGFRNTAYWDKNAWRTGYGSDTVTRADGTVEKVTESTVVTKEDAERDLVRRAGMSQGQVRKSIGDEAWGKLDARARASLTSVAYNYGHLPDAVAKAARTGDTEAVANSILGLAGHNAGINARRRAIEAANVRGKVGPEGRPSLAEQGMIMNEIEADESLSPQAKAAAVAQVNRTYRASRDEQIRQKTAFESSVKDSTAEAMQTGETSNPIPESRFMQQYGDVEGPVKYREYVNEVQFGADKHAFETMSNLDIQTTIDARMPAPGTPGYAHQIGKVERLRKYADELQKQRREDPAGSVTRLPAVKAVPYDPRKPETFRAVAAARLAAQETLGIEPEYRSPITKAEALDLTIPLRTMLPGQERDTMMGVAKKFEAMFGDYSEQAFSYAMRAMKVDVETAQLAGRLAKKMALGQPITVNDAASADAAAERDAATKAVEGDRDLGGFTGGRVAPSRPPRAGPRVIGNPEELDPTDPGAGRVELPNVPPGAIQFLLQNPAMTADFDKKYGAGRAKQILERFKGPPVAPDGRY